MSATYHPSYILLKNDINLYMICKHVLAWAVSSLHKNLAQYWICFCYLDVGAFWDGMSSNLVNCIAKYHVQHVWLVSNGKYLPCSRTVIWCIWEFFANRQNLGTQLTMIVPLFTNHKRRLSLFCKFILTEISGLRYFLPCRDLMVIKLL